MIDKIKELWVVSGSLPKKYYFRLIPILGLITTIATSVPTYINFWIKSTDGIFEIFATMIFYIVLTALFATLLYLNLRFYPWVHLMLSQVPGIGRFFRVHNGFLDAITDGYRQAVADTDRLKPRVAYNVYKQDFAGLGLRHAGVRSNDGERNTHILINMIFNYLFMPILQILMGLMAFQVSAFLGFIAVPLVYSKLQ